MNTAPTDLVDRVDEVDRVIGQVSRAACHGNPALIHRAVHIHLFNPTGELLLQLRASHKQVQPDRWDTSVGGHLEVGESYLAGARREMVEELGLSGIPLTFLYYSTLRNRFEAENIATYRGICTDPVVFNPDEISAVRFWSAAEIEASLGQGVFTPNFEEEWSRLQDWERRYLGAGGERLGFCQGESFPDLFAGLQTEGELD